MARNSITVSKSKRGTTVKASGAAAQVLFDAMTAKPEQPPILKGIGKINGDGWKDVTRKGETVFVWNEEMPAPHAPGQYPRIGNEGWSASTSQYDFTPATAADARDLRAAIARAIGTARPDQAQHLAAALEGAITQLEGWVSWKCPARHVAEHTAYIAGLRAVLKGDAP